MERFEPGIFTDRVLESVRVLRREIMPVFSRRVSEMIRVMRRKMIKSFSVELGSLKFCVNEFK